MSTPTASFAARKWECAWAGLILTLAGLFYFWTAISAGSPLTAKLQKDDLYNRLSDGFLAGQLSFLELPNPALASLPDPWDPAQNGPLRIFHDVSYFHGRYYLYFGPAPAVLLLAPWKAITGSYLGQNVGVAVFAWIGAGAGVALVLFLRRRYFPAVPGWIAGAGGLAMCFGNFIPILLRRPVYYELAIASAYAFAMIALLAIAKALDATPRQRWWLALAGFAYGLVLASRPNYLFGAIVLAVPLLPAWRAWRAGTSPNWRKIIGDVAALATPLGVILVLILWYNHARFDRWGEFGTSYMFAGMHPQKDVSTSFRFLPANLWFYFIAPPQLSAFFPFFQVIHMPWFTLPQGYIGEENIYGILPSLPFLWLIYFFRSLWKKGSAVAIELRDFILGVAVLVVVNLLVFMRLNGASGRYFVDIVPALTVLACIALFWAEQTYATGWRRRGLRIFWLGALTWTVAFNLFVSLQHNELLRYYNPGAYGRLAYAFNHVSSWLGQTSPTRTGPLRLKVVFPTERTGKLEPLVVTGLSFRADFIYLFYTDETHFQIGFEHTSYGGPLTKPPVEIDYAKEHTIDIEMGSLYPPIEHPYYDGMAPAEITRRKRTLRVVIDGRELLKGEYDFYDSSPGDISVGHNPVSDAFGRRFTGQVLSVERQDQNKK